MENKDYSARSASIGSMEAARRAGIRQAAMQEISAVVPIVHNGDSRDLVAAYAL
jgi:hypothetical protein